MKKNIQINLCGRLYQIDEDAYELLSHYTETLRNYFMKQEGGSEIADDIEQRIAELFDELMGNGTQAITIENVQSIISQIGDLKDITEGDEQDAKEKTRPISRHKRLPTCTKCSTRRNTIVTHSIVCSSVYSREQPTILGLVPTHYAGCSSCCALGGESS